MVVWDDALQEPAKTSGSVWPNLCGWRAAATTVANQGQFACLVTSTRNIELVCRR